MDEDIDKTGYSKLKTEALCKAFKYCTEISEISLGPEGSHSSPVKQNVDVSTAPFSKNLFQRKPQRTSYDLSDSEFEGLSKKVREEERYCAKKFLADLNEFCKIDAQKMKFTLLKKRRENLELAKAEIDRLLAKQMTNHLPNGEEQEKVDTVKSQLLETTVSPEIVSKEPLNKWISPDKDKDTKEKNSDIQTQYDFIYRNELEFTKVYSEIPDIIKNFKDNKVFLQAISSDIELAGKINGKFISLIEHCKVGEIAPVDVAKSFSLLRDIIAIKSKIKKEKDRIVAEIEEKREDEEMKEKPLEQLHLEKLHKEDGQLSISPADNTSKEVQESDVTISKLGINEEVEQADKSVNIESHSLDLATNKTEMKDIKDVPMDDLPINSGITEVLKEDLALNKSDEKEIPKYNYLDEYNKISKHFAEVENKLKPFIADESFKKYRSDCQKAVNLPVNAISPCSAAHLTDKLKKLSTLLQGQYVTVADTRVSTSVHPLGLMYCTNLLAEKIVKQGEQVVSSKPHAAFAIAAVTVALWMEFPDFGRLLLAQFYRRCPYLIPAYWEREENQSEEEYYKKLGFTYSGGTREELNMFLKRQGGIVRLYSSIIITDKKKSLQLQEHPFDVGEGWRLLVAFVKLEPKAEISPTVLLDILEVVGDAMVKAYGIQFHKLLHVICKSYLPKVVEATPDGMSGGPLCRLKNFLESIAKGKPIKPPKGLLPSNFW